MRSDSLRIFVKAFFFFFRGEGRRCIYSREFGYSNVVNENSLEQLKNGAYFCY